MDLAKLAIEKFAVFLTALIPGASAIYVYFVANPSPFHRFFAANELGYGTKIAIGTGLCFVVGYTLQVFHSSAFGALYGGMMPLIAAKDPPWPDLPESAPWRDPKWRKLATVYLGQNAPPNTSPILAGDFENRMSSLNLLPEPEQGQAKLELAMNRLKLASDDSDWRQWYTQIGRQQQEESKLDFADQFADSLTAYLETAAVYLLISLFLVPGVRNWMTICFSVGWCVRIIAVIYTRTRAGRDLWTSWSDQISFLTRKAIDSAQAGQASVTVEKQQPA